MCGKDRDEKRTKNIKVVLGSKSSSDNMDCPLSSQSELDCWQHYAKALIVRMYSNIQTEYYQYLPVLHSTH